MFTSWVSCRVFTHLFYRTVSTHQKRPSLFSLSWPRNERQHWRQWKDEPQGNLAFWKKKLSKLQVHKEWGENWLNNCDSGENVLCCLFCKSIPEGRRYPGGSLQTWKTYVMCLVYCMHSCSSMLFWILHPNCQPVDIKIIHFEAVF